MQQRKRKLVVAGAIIVVLVAFGTLLSQQIPATVSAPLFLLVVVIEVIIAPIPGGAVGYMGAAKFGFWQAWPLLYVGNIIGTTAVFFLARRYGGPLFEENVSESARRRFDEKLQKSPLLMLLVYSVPVIPVDILSILAGLSNISAKRFLLTAYVGYISYTAIVAYVGAFLADYIGVTNALSVLGGIFLLGLIWWIWRENRKSSRTSPAPRGGPKMEGKGNP